VWTKPAKLLFICKLTLEHAKVRHNILNSFPDQALGVEARRLANKLVAFAECES